MAEPPDDPTDEAIEARLATVPDDGWVQLWDAVDQLAAEVEHATWAGGDEGATTIVDGVEVPVLHLPYVVYGEAVNRLVQLLYGLGLIVPFNWPAWDGARRYRTGRGLTTAPVADAVRLLTAVVRADRFSEGTIAVTLDDGTVPAALSRLRQWYDEERRLG